MYPTKRNIKWILNKYPELRGFYDHLISIGLGQDRIYTHLVRASMLIRKFDLENVEKDLEIAKSSVRGS